MTVLSLCPRCVVTGEAVEAGPMIGASFGGRDAGPDSDSDSGRTHCCRHHTALKLPTWTTLPRHIIIIIIIIIIIMILAEHTAADITLH